jgi:2'-5' RNA ligase
MPSLELTFDDAADAAVREDWVALQDAGLPSQARHTGASNRPHVTLLYSNDPLDPPPITGLPIELTVATPLVFGSAKRGFLLARLVRPNRELLELHRLLHERAGDGPGVDPLTRPGAWTPHVTLARRIPADDLGRALSVVSPGRTIDAIAVAARHWDSATKTITPLAFS